MHEAKQSPETFNVLLVDSEGPVANIGLPHPHLSRRDNWDLTEVAEDAVQLMIQVMETWIVADPEAVARYYG